MSDIGEKIAVAVLMQSSDPCNWCKKRDDDEKKNDLAEEPSSVGGGIDAPPENDLGNDSSKLGVAVGSRPNWRVPIPGNPERLTTVVPAAHHLIPGNASLARATPLLKYVDPGKGLIRSDIGYNVNCQENGVWLPGSYGVNQDASDFNCKWSGYPASKQHEYAEAAMRAGGAQFHDSHGDYSTNVKGTLNSIGEKLDAHREAYPKQCPYCGADIADADKLKPPYGLVGKLNTVSQTHRRFLTGSGIRPKLVQSGYYTSKRVLTIFGLSK